MIPYSEEMMGLMGLRGLRRGHNLFLTGGRLYNSFEIAGKHATWLHTKKRNLKWHIVERTCKLSVYNGISTVVQEDREHHDA